MTTKRPTWVSGQQDHRCLFRCWHASAALGTWKTRHAQVWCLHTKPHLVCNVLLCYGFCFWWRSNYWLAHPSGSGEAREAQNFLHLLKTMPRQLQYEQAASSPASTINCNFWKQIKKIFKTIFVWFHFTGTCHPWDLPSASARGGFLLSVLATQGKKSKQNCPLPLSLIERKDCTVWGSFIRRRREYIDLSSTPLHWECGQRESASHDQSVRQLQPL